MDSLLKLAPATVLAAFLALIIKKDNPQTALMVSITALILILMSVFPEIQTVTDFLRKLSDYSSLSNEMLLPLIKIVGVSIVTSIASNLCKDADEKTLSYAAELAGAIAAIIIAIPLFTQVLSLILSIV